MKIIYFATAEFAVAALKALANSRHDIACVVTQPPKKQGRGFKIVKGAIEEFALSRSIEVLRFSDINSASAAKSLKDKAADMFIVSAFGQILSKEVLSIPRLYPINIHASLLPRYRGASPIQRAILNGDKKTGISIIIMNESLDKGDIIAQKSINIDQQDDIIGLTAKLSRCAAELILKVVDKIESGGIKPVKQNEDEAVYAPKLTKQDGLIDWNRTSSYIVNQVRACRKWPFAYTFLDGKRLKILRAERFDFKKENAKCGEVVFSDKDRIIVFCRDSSLLIKELQLEGKKPLETEDFLRGHDIPVATILG
jgi:methionyl-tRNA formyltransferase